MAKSLLIAFSVVNLVLALSVFAVKLIQTQTPALYDFWRHIIASCAVGFAMTWVFVTVTAIVYGLLSASKKGFGTAASEGRTKSVIYCRDCRCLLADLSQNRCPKCGQQFDLNDPTTFQRTATTTWDRFMPFVWVWFICASLLVMWFLLGLIRFVFPNLLPP
jgi:uncharacterized paraquat-inducible protein A